MYRKRQFCVQSVRPLILAFMVWALSAPAFAGETDAKQPETAQLRYVLNMEILAGNEHWDIVHAVSEGEVQELRLHHFKWMMDFLHWRPLTKERQKLDMAYVRHLLKTFWGPAMPFELTGVESTLTVNGHPAYEVEGTLGKGRIRTRFIVWNCPESSRQFIADININQARKTPPEIFDVERQSVLTVRCHGEPHTKPGAVPLNSVYASAALGISFQLPANWHTETFTRKEWYPDGVSKESGSLWTLLTDSEKGLHLFSWNASGSLTSELFTKALQDHMGRPFPTPDEGMWRITKFDLGEPVSANGCLAVSGWMTSEEKGADWSEVKPHRVAAWMFDAGDSRYLLVASMAAWNEMWKRPVDLTPSKPVFDTYIRDQVKPAVRWPLSEE